MNVPYPASIVWLMPLLLLVSGCGNEPELNVGPDQLVVIESERDFDAHVIKADRPVLVDFWSRTCGICRRMNPVILEAASAYDGALTVAKVNIEENTDLVRRFHIKGLPTLMIFDRGSVVTAYEGGMGKKAFDRWLQEHLGKLNVDLPPNPS